MSPMHHKTILTEKRAHTERERVDMHYGKCTYANHQKRKCHLPVSCRFICWRPSPGLWKARFSHCLQFAQRSKAVLPLAGEEIIVDSVGQAFRWIILQQSRPGFVSKSLHAPHDEHNTDYHMSRNPTARYVPILFLYPFVCFLVMYLFIWAVKLFSSRRTQNPNLFACSMLTCWPGGS